MTNNSTEMTINPSEVAINSNLQALFGTLIFGNVFKVEESSGVVNILNLTLGCICLYT